MKRFRVGDKFKANEFAGMVEVRWIDPADEDCALVFNVANKFDAETVFAADFFNDWTLVEDGAGPVPQ
jgi:hypothetical protein